MKPDTNTVLNKLIAYAFDNYLLDSLDQTYKLNRLASLCALPAPTLLEADYGRADIYALLDELKAAAPAVNIVEVADALFPPPRNVNYYFADELSRKPQKAFDFLFDLCARGYKTLDCAPAYTCSGYTAYAGVAERPVCSVVLPDCNNALYTPLALGGRVAELTSAEIVTDDILRTMTDYVTAYGGAIAIRPGSDSYLTCNAIAPSFAPVVKEISDGAVKIDLLDYPVPALAVYGMAKNSAAREAARIVKAAAEEGLALVLAAAATDQGAKLYIVFSGEVSPSGVVAATDALTACGVFRTVDCSALLPVLEKGTALSTDLAAFKPIYDRIGGQKLGAKTAEKLGGALVDLFKPTLAACASTSADHAAELAANK